MLTVIAMYRDYGTEMLTAVVDGCLTAEQRRAWRDAYGCDHNCNKSDMFFCEIAEPGGPDKVTDLVIAERHAKPHPYDKSLHGVRVTITGPVHMTAKELEDAAKLTIVHSGSRVGDFDLDGEVKPGEIVGTLQVGTRLAVLSDYIDWERSYKQVIVKSRLL